MTTYKKGFTRFLAVLAICCVTQSSVLAHHGQFKHDRFYAGMGPIFSDSAVGYFQAGFDVFDVFTDEKSTWHCSLGPLLGLAFTSHFFGTDIDMALKVLHEIDVGKNYALGVYGKLPLGVSMGFAPGFALGFNVGLIPGVEFYFDENFGVFGELGFFHHSYFGVSQNSQDYHVPAGTFNLGLIYSF